LRLLAAIVPRRPSRTASAAILGDSPQVRIGEKLHCRSGAAVVNRYRITTTGKNIKSERGLTNRRLSPPSGPLTLYMKQICSIQSIPKPAKTKTPAMPTVVEYFEGESLSYSREQMVRAEHREATWYLKMIAVHGRVDDKWVDGAQP
jgi:hypothetical protein